MKCEALATSRPHVRGILVALVVVAAVVPYLGVLNAPFVFDDVKLVRDNAFLRSAAEDPSLVLKTFDITSRRWDEEELRPNYRPLRFLSYLIDYRLTRWWFGSFSREELPPFFFHASNVLFHALAALLVFAIATSLLGDLFAPAAGHHSGTSGRAASAFASGQRPMAWFGGFCAGLIFALHPLGTEAVTYVSGRRDVLSTCFFLGAVWLVVREKPRESPRTWTVIGAPLLFVLGLLTKEMVITLAPALLLVDWVRGARWSVRRFLLHGLLWGLTVTFVVVTLGNDRLVAAAGQHPDERVGFTACRYVLRYLGLVLLPVSQTVDYSYRVIPPSRGFLSPWTTLPAVLIVCGLVLAGLTLLAERLSATRRGAPGRRAWAGLLALGTLWFAGTLVPVLQFVPIAERFAERFAYLPAIGIILIAAGVLQRLRDRGERRLSAGVLVALSLICLVATVGRNQDWRSPLRLWTAAVEVGPDCARAHFGRAHALKAVGRLREAAEEYTAALDLFRERPDIPLHHGYILQALTLRGGVYGELGRSEPALLEQAIRDYRDVLASTDTDGTPIAGSPRHTAVQFDLAQYLVLADRKVEAIEAYQRVIEIGSPASLVGAAHYYLGKIALVERDIDDATRSLRLAYDTLPEEAPQKYQVAAELADIYLDAKDLDAAAGIVDDALGRDPGDEEELYLLLRRAKILDRRGDLSATIEILHQILGKDPDYAPALITLAGIEANLGQLESAESRYRRVLRREPGHPEARDGLRALLLRRQASDPAPDVELAALERRGLEHLERVELTAARDVFAALLETAKAAENRQYQAVALRGLGGVESRFGRFDQARTYLEAALEIEPRNAATLLGLGDLLLRRFDDKGHQDDRDEARRYYLRYLDALAEGEEPRARVYVSLAQLTMDSDPAVALRYCSEAVRLEYDVPVLDATLGHVYAGLGEWEKSLDAFNRYLDREFDEAKKENVRQFVRESVLPNL